MAILSHGDEGLVYGTDSDMQVKKLVEPLKECKTLFGKPKLLFIQVCMTDQWLQQLTCFLLLLTCAIDEHPFT